MSRTGIWIANGALLVLCCYLVARIATEVAADLLVPTTTVASVVPVRPPAPAKSWAERQAILDRNLFKVSTLVPDEAPEPDLSDEVYEKTKLPLRLLGTAAADDPRLSWAAVEDLDNREHLVVRVDDRLKDRAEVMRIERRRIVLRNGGRLEELALDEEPQAVRTTRRRSLRSTRTARGNTPSRRIEQLAKNRFAVDREDVQSVANNPAALFSQARILPKYENGEMVGVQLNAIKSGSLFEQIGIQDGDTIKEFNGIQVTSQRDSAELLRELTQAKEFDVTVFDADGNERKLQYELR